MKKELAAITLLTIFSFSLLAQTPNKQSVPAVNEGNPFGTPLSGVEVILEQDSGAVVKTVQTDASGKFEFSGLRPGTYRIKSGSTVSSPRDHATGQASGKQVPFIAASSAPRDAASGQASGKHIATVENNDTAATTEANRAVINTSRSNIKSQRVAAEIIPDDEADPSQPARAGIGISRSNISNKPADAVAETNSDAIAVQIFNEETPTNKRAFVLPHVLEKAGLMVEVNATGRIVGNVLKTRHDTVKNSINNVR